MLQMGYATSFGVFLEGLHTTQLPDTPLSTLTLIGGCSNFVRFSTRADPLSSRTVDRR